MDTQWFKQQQRRAGLTSFDLGAAIGRDRSAISKIINGYQKMTLDQARIFSEKLGVSLPEMLERSGLADGPTAQQLAPGFAASDAAPFAPAPGTEANMHFAVAEAFGMKAGLNLWRVKSRAMALAGLLEGDFLLVDTLASERARAGDVVIAQVQHPQGLATVLRRYEPPVLVAASTEPGDARVFVVDTLNVVIRGKVVASWRG